MRRKAYIFALISAILFCLTFPPLPLGFLAYFSLVFLFFAMENKRDWHAFKLGYIWGLITNSLLLFWIAYAAPIAILGAVLAILILSLYPAFLFLLFNQVQKKLKTKAIFFFPFLWVGMEYLRSLGEIGFPWLNIAHTQTYYLELIQYASFTGVWGISFWVILLNVLVFLVIKNYENLKRFSMGAFVFLLFLIIPYIHGRSVIPDSIQKNDIRVALLQGNIPPNIKWHPDSLDYNFRVYTKMTQQAAEKNVDLIIWPETASPCYLTHEPLYYHLVQSLAESLNTHLIMGSNEYKILGYLKYVYYNSAFFFTPGYHFPEAHYKLQLVPFSERVPFSDRVHVLDKIELGTADFSPGQEYVIFEHPKGEFATLICFEIIFPDLVRKFVKRDAEFLVNITNDAWFGKTHGPFQHARIAIFRAIENRISIARCANTGISMFVDPYGRISHSTSLFDRKIVVGVISKREEKTFYSTYGDWFALGCSFFSLGILGLSFLLRKP
ncbi:MAG: apolipoprotein N-acyltransferase [Candidatus Zixiibacteriota bacterium]